MTILAIILFFISAGKSVEMEVDKIEINTCHAEFVQEFNRWKLPVIAPCYKQILIYDWSQEYGRYHIMDWQMIESVQAIWSADKKNKWHSMYEEKPCLITKIDGYYHVQITVHKKLYKLKTKVLTYTECLCDDDPERKNKEVFEEKYRNKIFK